jgi:hypothetical protein
MRLAARIRARLRSPNGSGRRGGACGELRTADAAADFDDRLLGPVEDALANVGAGDPLDQREAPKIEIAVGAPASGA